MGLERDLLLDCYLGSQKLREILTLLYCITLSSSRENQCSAQEVANSKARGTSRSCQIKNTRERDQKHSYWYIPSAPRVNYSLLVMESAGMMKMATGEGSPLRQGAGTGSSDVFGGYRGLPRRNSRSIVLPDIFRVYGHI